MSSPFQSLIRISVIGFRAHPVSESHIHRYQRLELAHNLEEEGAIQLTTPPSSDYSYPNGLPGLPFIYLAGPKPESLDIFPKVLPGSDCTINTRTLPGLKAKLLAL